MHRTHLAHLQQANQRNRMVFGEHRRLNVVYRALKNLKAQLFSVDVAKSITGLDQIALRFTFGSRDIAQVERFHTMEVMIDSKLQMIKSQWFDECYKIIHRSLYVMLGERMMSQSQPSSSILERN